VPHWCPGAPSQHVSCTLRSYTAQVLAKSCKLIPVMIARFVMDGKRYSVLEYTAAALIAGTSTCLLAHRLPWLLG